MPTRAERRGLLRRGTLDRGAYPYSLARYPVANLPAAALWTGAHVYVVDDISGGVEAFSDGVNWRRVTDQAIVRSVTPASAYGVAAGLATLHAVAGPYMRSNAAATAILRASSRVSADLSAAGAAVATLGTPPKVPADLSSAGAGTGTLVGVAV